MTRLEDLLPSGTEAEWTCGHVAGAVCAQCYRNLARRAHELAAENDALRDANRALLAERERLSDANRRLFLERDSSNG